MQKKLTETQINHAVKQAKASLEIEGQFLQEGAEELIKRKMRGEMTHAEFTKAALELAKNEG